MKYLVLLSFTLVFTFNCQSQNFAEKGATWHYTKHFSFSSTKSYVKVESIKDTVIDGKSCHQLSLIGGGLCNYYESTIFVYEEDSVVYFSLRDTNRFEKLYDFTTKKDSSWTIKYRSYGPYDDSIWVRVDSTGKKNLNGQDLKLLYVTYGTFPIFHSRTHKSQIIEKIGDINYMFNWYMCIDGQNAGGLRCYRDPSFGVYTSWIAPSCTATGVQEYDELDLVNIYPNPASSILNLELQNNSTYQILDINGRMLQKNSLLKGKNSIDVHYLKAGIYILQIENQGAISSYKFLKE